MLSRIINPMNRVFKSANTPFEHADPVVHRLYTAERRRQRDSIELIASENFVSRGVLEALGTEFYHGGNGVVDGLETLCKERALEAFDLDPSRWGCDVQPCFAAYTDLLLKPNDRVMGLDPPSGAHGSSVHYHHYGPNEDTGYIDYDRLEEQANEFRPNVIICGSAYPRDYDYARFRQIADQTGAYLLCDISGLLMAAGCGGGENRPFDHADVVTTTTHESLRGPRSEMVFFRKEHTGVFPALQGGPRHNHEIAALCVALKQCMDPTFETYIRQAKANARALAEYLVTERGHKLITGGTDNHLILWDLRPLGITGDRFETMCDACDITVSRNIIGTPAMTSRGFKEPDFVRVGQLLCDVVDLCVCGDTAGPDDIDRIRGCVHELTRSFPMPGF